MSRFLFLFAASWAVACAGHRSAAEGSAEPHPLVGTWQLMAGEQQRPGTRLTLTVDSADATTFYGRLTSYFSGNVGIDPRVYRPFSGEISAADGAVRLVVEPDDPRALPLGLGGRFAGDSIAVAWLTIGPDTLRGTRSLFLVREHHP